MQQRLQERVRAARAGDGGFTLIELLIVIVILGVLAGIVVFSVNFISNRGESTACKTDVRNVQTAVEALYASTGKYPEDFNSGDPLQGLVDQKVLKSKPSSDKYTISYSTTTHTVTGLVNGATGNC